MSWSLSHSKLQGKYTLNPVNVSTLGMGNFLSGSSDLPRLFYSWAENVAPPRKPSKQEMSFCKVSNNLVKAELAFLSSQLIMRLQHRLDRRGAGAEGEACPGQGKETSPIASALTSTEDYHRQTP